MKAIFLFSFRNYSRKKFQTLTLVVSLALSVGLCTLVALQGAGTLKSFERSVEDLASDTDLIITMDDTGFPKGVLDQVLDLPEVDQAVPLLKQKVFFKTTKEQSRDTLTIVGIDLLNQSSLSISDTGKSVVRDPLAFMANPQSLAVSESFERDFKIREKQSLFVLTPAGEETLVINGIFAEDSFTKVHGANLGVMDIEAARLLFKRPDKIDQINVKLNDGISLDAGTKKIRDTIGLDYTVTPPSQLVNNLQQTIKPFQSVLGLMAGLTFVLFIYLLLNISSNSINERRQEFGVLRAIGCSRQQLGVLIMSEYALLSTLGSFSGAMLAWSLAPSISNKLNSMVSYQFGPAVDLSAEHFDPTIGLIIALISVVIILGSIAKTVWEIIQVSPVEAMTAVKKDIVKIGTRQGAPWLLALSLLPLAFDLKSQVWYLLPLLGTIVFGPQMVVLLLTKLGMIPAVAQHSLLRLAWEYAISNPKRVRGKVRGVIIGLMLIFTMRMVQSSFQHGLQETFATTSRPDMLVTGNSDLTAVLQMQPLHESIAKELSVIPGVIGVYAERISKIQIDGKTATLRAFDEVPPTNPRLAGPYSHFQIVDRPAAEAGRDLHHGAAVDSRNVNILASETLRNNIGVDTGDTLILVSPQGPLNGKVVGIIRDISAGVGSVFIARTAYRHWWKDELVSGFAVSIASDNDEERVKKAIEKGFTEKYGLLVTLDKKLRADVIKAVDRGFAYISYIEYLILIVALLNFVSAYVFEIRERSRQFGTLRSLGMPKVRLLRMVLIEAFLLAGASVLFSCLISMAVAFRLITSGLTTALGWYISFYFDVIGTFFMAAAACTLIGLMGLIPAWKASRTDVTEAMKG